MCKFGRFSTVLNKEELCSVTRFNIFQHDNGAFLVILCPTLVLVVLP